MLKGGKHPKETISPNLLLKQPMITCLGPLSLFTEPLGRRSMNVAHKKNCYNLAIGSKLISTNHFTYSLIIFRVFLTFQFAGVTRFIHLEIRMSGELTAQFDGLYKSDQVFGLVLELNDPPAQFPLSRNMSTFLGIMLPATARK